MPRLDSMRDVGNDLWFVFLQKAEEVPKAVMGFRVEENGEQPEIMSWVNQYFRPFQTTRPPKNTTKGSRRT